MKRFWLFTFANYYPEGGMNDFEKDFSSVEDALNYHSDKYEQCSGCGGQLLDTQSGKIIYLFNSGQRLTKEQQPSWKVMNKFPVLSSVYFD